MNYDYPNICIITLDSLRYDIAIKSYKTGKTSNIARYGKWEKCQAHGDNTLPSHVALFQGGQVPYSLEKGNKYYFETFRFFKPELNWDRKKEAVYLLPEADSIPKSFELLGYETIGIGGVDWFNSNHLTSKSLWFPHSDYNDFYLYFKQFYWYPHFNQNEKESFRNQLKLCKRLDLDQYERLFFFINISSTHIPYHRGGGGLQGQKAELEYFDFLFPKFVELMPKPCHFLIMSDHGTCFGDDELWGHGFGHPKVWEVPVLDFRILGNICN